MSSFAALLDQIYPALDNGKYDEALQLCLKPEVSKFTLGKALLSYTYSCMRNYGKAFEIARAVAATQPTEGSVVSTLGCTFKILKAETEFAELYENALKKKNLETSYVIELFSCYCRLNDPKKMQFVAQKLHKATPDKVCYLYWSIACMMLQDLPPAMMVLAEKMAFKVLYDLNALTQPSADELGLYSFILVRQGKFTQALDALVQLRSRPSGTLLTDETHFAENPQLVKMLSLQYSVYKIDLLLRQARLAEVVVECKVVLEKFPDQWNVHAVLVDALLYSGVSTSSGVSVVSNDAKQLVFPDQDLSSLLNSVLGSGDSVIDRAVYTPELTAQVHKHIAYLHTLQTANPKLRGPYLAELRLLTQYTRILQHNATTNTTLYTTSNLWTDVTSTDISSTDSTNALVVLVHNAIVLVTQYVRRFSTKQCCFSDVKGYLCTIHTLCAALDTTLFAQFRTWAVGMREDKLVVLRDAMDAAEAVTSAGSGVSGAGSSAGACTGAAAPMAVEVKSTPEVENEEEGEADEVEEPTTTTGATSVADGTGVDSGAAAKKKKNKKKKKSATAKAAATTTTTTSTTTVNKVDSSVVNEHNDILLYLCTYCKYDQLVSYCDYLTNTTTSTSTTTTNTSTTNTTLSTYDTTSILLRTTLYLQSIKLFKNGVGGELRNIQPGDELVLQNSSLYRIVHGSVSSVDSTCTTNTSTTGTTGTTGSTSATSTSATSTTTASTTAATTSTCTCSISNALSWAQLLQQGREASPYAFAFRMDSIEPYRVLGMGETALEAFKEMGVKHIQHDSMSYLVLPALVESGFFAEAAKQMHAVCNFHIVGQRDSLDMLSRAFQYGNYMKVIELSRFVDHCQRSTQLVASRAELPLLEVVTTHHTAAAALKYLEDVMEGDKALTQPLFDAAKLATMVDHMDYNLQVRTDQRDETAKTAEAKLYRTQIEQRIRSSQATMHMLYHSLKRGAEAAIVHFEAYLQVVAEQQALVTQGYHQWDQQYHHGSPRTTQALNTTIASCYRLCIRAIGTSSAALESVPSSSSSAGVSAGFTSVSELVASTTSAVRSLFLLKRALLDGVQPFVQFGDSSATTSSALKVVCPEWLRAVAHFVRTVGTELALLLQVCLSVHKPSQTVDTTTQLTLAQAEEHLTPTSISTLSSGAVLSLCVELLTTVYVDVVVSVQHVADATVTTLTGLRASDLAAALSVVDGSSVAGVSSGAGGVGGAGGVSGAVDSVVVDTEDVSLQLSAAVEVVDLCADSDNEEEQATVKGSAATTTVTSVGNAIAAEKKRVKDAKKAATANTSAPKVSRSVTSAEAQLLLAQDLLSSHTESCLRLAGALAQRADVLGALLKA